jgi:hypothetical protein
MSLRGQSWIATVLMTLGLLGLVVGSIIRSSGVMWASAASAVAGFVVFVIVVRNTSRAIAGHGQEVEHLLAQVAKAQALKKKDGGPTATP